MSQGGMGGGYGSPALQLALCTIDQLAWQQALWTFAQGRAAYQQVHDIEGRIREKAAKELRGER